MDYNKDLQNDIVQRLKKLQQEMLRLEVDACIISTNVNLFYLTGSIYGGYLYLPTEGNPINFVKRDGASFLENEVHIRKPEQIIEELQKRDLSLPKKVLLEVDILSYNECNRLIASLGITEIVNASTLLRNLRSIKSDFELSQVRLCARQHELVYNQVPSVFKRGMTDVELQIEIERLMRLYGSFGIFRTYGENMDIYMGSLLAGDNAGQPSPFDFGLGGKGASPILPLGSSGSIIEEGQTIMVDMGGNYKPWMTDMTRVFSVGKTTEAAYKAHKVSQEIEDAITHIAKPGVACADLYNKAMEIVIKNKLEACFMGTTQQAKFVGHGLGLEINEPPVLTPRSKEILQTNIVFAIEPKFIIAGVGAVGVENTFVVNEQGIEKLTILEEDIIEL